MMKRARKVAVVLSVWGILTLRMVANGQVPVAQRTVYVNLGAGFQGSRFNTSTWRPSYQAHVDYAVFNNTTVGLEGAYYGEKLAKQSRFDSYAVGVRSDYYVNALLNRRNKKVNYYAGLGVMYYAYKYTDFSATKGRVYVPVHVGLKRSLAKNWGAYTELGFNDMGFLKIGLTATL